MTIALPGTVLYHSLRTIIKSTLMNANATRPIGKVDCGMKSETNYLVLIILVTAPNIWRDHRLDVGH